MVGFKLFVANNLWLFGYWILKDVDKVISKILLSSFSTKRFIPKRVKGVICLSWIMLIKCHAISCNNARHLLKIKKHNSEATIWLLRKRQPHFAIFYNHNPLKMGAKKKTPNEFILNWDRAQSINLIISTRHNRYTVGSNVYNITIKS